MTKIINSYLTWHYGDNLIHLNFLRRLAKQHPDISFVHYCDPNQHAQLLPVILDLGNIALSGGPLPPDAIDAWINTGASHRNPGGWDGKGRFDNHQHRWDYVAYYLDFFDHLAKQMGLENPVKTPMDMLFDFPALKESRVSNLNFDILVINSRPASGQLRWYNDPFCMDHLINRLQHKGHKVACTQETRVPDVYCTAKDRLSLVDIGNLSLRTTYIVAVSTGPIWLTHNIWNLDSVKYRIVLLERQRVHFPGNGCHVETLDDAARKLQELGIL